MSTLFWSTYQLLSVLSHKMETWMQRWRQVVAFKPVTTACTRSMSWRFVPFFRCLRQTHLCTRPSLELFGYSHCWQQRLILCCPGSLCWKLGREVPGSTLATARWDGATARPARPKCRAPRHEHIHGASCGPWWNWSETLPWPPQKFTKSGRLV